MLVLPRLFTPCKPTPTQSYVLRRDRSPGTSQLAGPRTQAGSEHCSSTSAPETTETSSSWIRSLHTITIIHRALQSSLAPSCIRRLALTSIKIVSVNALPITALPTLDDGVAAIFTSEEQQTIALVIVQPRVAVIQVFSIHSMTVADSQQVQLSTELCASQIGYDWIVGPNVRWPIAQLACQSSMRDAVYSRLEAGNLHRLVYRWPRIRLLLSDIWV